MNYIFFIEVSALVIIMALAMRASVGVYTMACRTLEFARLDKDYLQRYETRARDLREKIEASQKQRALMWHSTRQFEVVWREYENPDRSICSFYLVPTDKRPLPPFGPGQHLTVNLPVEAGADPLIRCYSLSDSPSEQRYYRLTVKRLPPPPGAPDDALPGRASNWLHDNIEPGSKIDVLAPAGDFCLNQASNRPVVLIAGGVGITPLVSMLNYLVATRSKRKVWLFYGVRDRADHAMYDHLEALRRDNPNIRTATFYGAPTDTCRRGVDYDVEGFMSADVIRSVLDTADYEFYVCGPAAMMQKIIPDLWKWGVPQEDIRYEAFGPASLNFLPSTDQSDANETFQVEFSRSGKTIQWGPQSTTILDLAEANGVKMRHGCRAGNCGTCLTPLSQGRVGYVRAPVKHPSPGSCLPCIARPKSDLVLDL